MITAAPVMEVTPRLINGSAETAAETGVVGWHCSRALRNGTSPCPRWGHLLTVLRSKALYVQPGGG
jgi:hypothetical protein